MLELRAHVPSTPRHLPALLLAKIGVSAVRPDPGKASRRVNDVLGYSAPVVAKMLERKFPETWRRMMVRTTHAPGDYYSNKVVQVGLVGAIEEARAQVGGLLESNVGPIAGVLEKFDFPIYHVSGPLLEALKRSHPPTGMTWADLKLPFPGMCFMVPRMSLVEPEPTEGEVACLGYARFASGDPLRIPTVEVTLPIPESRISVFWFIAPSGLVCNDVTFPEAHPLEPLAEWIDSKSEGRPYRGPPGSFTSWMAGLVANLILVMEARRELVEPGSRLPGKARGIASYAPTFVGRNYSVLRRERGDGSERRAQFTELGWRAGHFKRQRFGERSEQSRVIFVDPYVAFTRGLRPIEEAK